jgi:uncharacterized protein YdiU (UPF0061 family)
MDNFMALEILKVLKKGESNGYQTIQRDILDMESFMDKTETDFQNTFRKLEELKHVIDYRDESTNNMQAFRLNNEKDYISFYENKVNSANNDNNLEVQIKQLNLDKLQYEATIRGLQKKLSEAQLKDIPKNSQHRDDLRIWQIATGIAVIVAFLLKLFGVQGWL